MLLLTPCCCIFKALFLSVDSLTLPVRKTSNDNIEAKAIFKLTVSGKF